MRGVKEDLVGQQFDSLRVEEELPRRAINGGVRWRCRCLLCGDPVVATTGELRSADVRVRCACEQQEHKRSRTRKRALLRDRPVEIDGVEKPLLAWIKEYGVVDARLVYNRIRRGWDPVRAISTPAGRYF